MKGLFQKLMDGRIKGECRLPPPPKVAPWLVIPHGKHGKFHSFYNICADDEENKKSSNKFIQELSKRQFWQKDCHQGWVIVLCHDDNDTHYGDCLLWNPQTLDSIQLPSILSVLHYYETGDKYRIKDCILTSPHCMNTSITSNSNSKSSSSSSSSNGGNDSMVYILFAGYYRDYLLIFCHPGEKEWKWHKLNASEEPKKMLFLRNKLHIMCAKSVCLEIEVQGMSGIDVVETLAVDHFEVSKERIVVYGAAGGCSSGYWEVYLESFGEVFIIHRWYILRGGYENWVCRIGIWKLDFASMAWENVKSLDDRVFFISDHTQLSCLASDLGLSKGCVYYTQDGEMSLYKLDLEDDSVLFSLPCPDLPTPSIQPEWLMITTTPSVDDKRPTADADCMLGKVKRLDEVMKITNNIAGVASDDEESDIDEARPGIFDCDDLVWSVSNHLHTLDYIHLRAVSKRHRAIMSLKRSSSAGNIQATILSPWLVYSNYDRSVFSFVNPFHGTEKYLMNISEMLKGFRICFSKGGWLLMSNQEKLFFHNPFTRSSIKLPDLPDYNGGIFSGISFSSLPTSPDCTVFVFEKPLGKHFGYYDRPFGNMVSIYFIKRGEDHWRDGSFDGTYLAFSKKCLEFDTGMNNPVFYKGAFYCLDLNGTLGRSKQKNGISWEVLSVVPRPNCDFTYESYLVECKGKLLCVLLGHTGKWVRIFRLSNSKMVWGEVKTLGRHMLCISNTSSISAVAPTSEMENKIYFARLREEGILFYSLDTGLYQCLGSGHSTKDYRDSKGLLCCSWIEPNWSKSSGQSLDWLSI